MISLAILFSVVAATGATLTLFKHVRVSSLIASIGVFTQLHWLFATLLHRTLFTSYEPATVYAVLTSICAVGWLSLFRRYNWPALSLASLRREIPVLVLILITVASGYLVVSHNGFIGEEWVVHGFYNGDTLTFASLVQGSLTTSHLSLPNPFAAGSALEYPTLVHASWASFFLIHSLANNWLKLLPIITLVQILLTVPLFFLVWDTVFPQPPDTFKRWFGIRSRVAIDFLQTVIVLYIMMVSWDSYIYPQGHFFLTAAFLLLVALLIRASTHRSLQQTSFIITAIVTALLLLFSNAVTGTAAVAILVVFHILRANDKSRSILERGIFLVTIGLWLLVFIFATPGNASWGLPSFSYTAAGDMVRLSVLVIALSIAALLNFGRHNFIVGAIAVLCSMALFTFLFSTRNIVIDNASRFFYHAALAGFPLLAGVLLRAYFYVRRELLLSTRTVSEWLFGATATLAVTAVVLIPAIASTMQSHDALLFKDETRVSPDELLALNWIKEHTQPNAIFISDPAGPWLIPQFTGRGILRSDYWLSPNDKVLQQAIRAFKGDNDAQRQISQQADYVYLKKSPDAIQALSGQPVFENSAVTIFSTH